MFIDMLVSYKIIPFLISFYSASLVFGADPDLYYHAGLFDQAAIHYQTLLEHAEKKDPIRLRLAKSYYFSRNYIQAAEILQEDSTPEGILLKGIIFNKLKDFPKAEEAFLSLGSLTEEAYLELALSQFKLKKYGMSKNSLTHVKNSALEPFALFLMVRIAIAENLWEEQKLFINLLKQKSGDPLFQNKIIPFLEGEALFHQKKYQEAAHVLENIEEQDADFYLGWSFFHLAEDTNTPLVEREDYLDRSIEIFQKLSHSDQGLMALGQALLIKGIVFKNSRSLNTLNDLLAKEIPASNSDLGLLLKAEASESYQERKRFFKKLTHQSHIDCPFYANAWYLHGLNELTEGRRLEADGKKHFNSAIEAFSKAFELLYPNHKVLAAEALKQQIYAYHYQGNKEGKLRGLSLIGQLLNRYRDELFPLMDEPDEIYYLQGMLASHLIGEEGNTFYSIAENSIRHYISSYPKGRFYEEAMKLLGALYFKQGALDKAEQAYLALAQKNPMAKDPGEAWHWAAVCREKIGDSQDKVRQYRKKAFESFPNSPFAAEACFRLYSFKEYLGEENEPLRHLKVFKEKFPDSPYRICSSYLEGLHAVRIKQSDDSIQAFQDAVDTYAKHPSNEYFHSIRCRALIEQSQLFLEDNWDKSREILENLCLELQGSNHPYCEECNYKLAVCYITGDQQALALKLLEEMLEKYKNGKISRGYYLSKTWFEAGKLAIKVERYEDAFECFEASEDAAKGKVLSTDELLDLWIQQSLCLQKLGQLENSMLLLSKIINYDAISSERLRAMYLRSEIYEAQERWDLAKRQLEALAKKGGSWALEAKIKLENKYAY